MEDSLKPLTKEGWHPCAEKIRAQLEKEKEGYPDVENLFVKDSKRWMLNEDIKDVANPSLPDGINSGRITTLSTPIVLQVKRVVNIAAPSYNQKSDGAPRMLKIFLTDGKVTCQGIEYASLPRFSLDVPMGAKVCLSGTVRLSHGMILLDNKNCQLLGGEVPHLIQEWRMQQMLLSHVRTGTNDDGPPPFVPFGQKIKRVDNDLKKSFEQKENAVADEGFLSQRQDAIAAAAQTNAAISVVKGSGKKLEMHQPERRGRGRGQRERRTREDREEAQKPRESLSLFDYLNPGIKEEKPGNENYSDSDDDIQVPDDRPSWERDGIYRPPGQRETQRGAYEPDRRGLSSRGRNAYGNLRDDRNRNASSFPGSFDSSDNSAYQGHGRGGRRGRGDSRGSRPSRGHRGGGAPRDIEDAYFDRRSYHSNTNPPIRKPIDTLTDDFNAWPGLETREQSRPSEKLASHTTSSNISREQWVVQDYCLAKWESTDQYYPAVIEQLIPDRKAATVVFVETGAVRIVETKHLLRDPQDNQSRTGFSGRSRGNSTRIFTSRGRGRY